MLDPIVLYGNRPVTSPYVMCVFVALEEKSLPFEFRRLDLSRGEQHGAEYVRLSITNRVPTLYCDGHYLSESVAITEYLEERFAPPEHARIYPLDRIERAQARMVQGLVRSDFMPLRVQRSTDTFFASAPIASLDPAGERDKQRLERIALALLAGKSYIGSHFCIADVDLATMLQRLCANRDPMPSELCDYARRIWERPSVRKWLALTEYKGA